MTGLGVTTVSKALKDAPDISAKTKQRVQRVAQQINYQPDRTGLRLRTGKTNVISFILNTEEEGLTEYSSQFIVGITQALEGTSYSLTVTPYSKDKGPLDPVRQVVESRSADGVILTCIEPDDCRIDYLQNSELPFATHGRSNMDVKHAYFDFDNEAFGRNAVQLLAKLGRRRVGIVFPSQQFTYYNSLRDGYYAGLRETGLKSCLVVTPGTNEDLDQIAAQVYEGLQKTDSPEAFVCTRFSHTLGALDAIERAGLAIGKDIDLVAKQSSSNFLKWFGRPIYSINEDFVAAGYTLAKSLIAIIDGDDVVDHQIMDYPDNWGEKVTDQ